MTDPDEVPVSADEAKGDRRRLPIYKYLVVFINGSPN